MLACNCEAELASPDMLSCSTYADSAGLLSTGASPASSDLANLLRGSYVHEIKCGGRWSLLPWQYFQKWYIYASKHVYMYTPQCV